MSLRFRRVPPISHLRYWKYDENSPKDYPFKHLPSHSYEFTFGLFLLTSIV